MKKIEEYINDILFVSYLKNKGVRRICFIIGLLLAWWFFCMNLSEMRYKIRMANESCRVSLMRSTR